MAAVEWLLKSKCTANPVDRFSRTPLDVSPDKATVGRFWDWNRVSLLNQHVCPV